MLWLIAIFAAVVAVPFLLETRRRPVRAELYPKAPGDFARLSQGITHYRWIGPTRGPVVIAIHGLSTPSPVWEDIENGLAHQGFRVLSYDLYGRGFSDAAPGRQGRDFFLQQLNDLLAHENLTQDLSFMGFSMGGSIATAFAAEHPDRVKQVILVAPAGIQANESQFSATCRRIPGFGDWLHALLAAKRLRAGIKSGPTSDDQKATQLHELKRRGFLPAILSSRRGMLMDIQETEHRSIAKSGIPVLAIWGTKDRVIPISAMGVLARWNPKALHETVAGAGHELPMTHGEKAADLIATMLQDSIR
ncbi:alpha/beta fold hydrolase [Aestuariibius sp. HNIBRBA575]|uniref:alpha/beta fold hydrolase n=1 Tax=Aestuariibius sp. HNIBRBA575 TaxID=3233343 RepID=UPI0034A2048C